MGNSTTTTIENKTITDTNIGIKYEGTETKKRLNNIVALNAEYARKNSIYKDEQEKLQAELMTNPLSSDKAFSYFGLMLGTIPPATIFGKFIYEASKSNDLAFLIIFLTFVTAVCGIAGFFTGKFVGPLVDAIEKRSWTEMLIAMPFIGALWGIISGGTGGIFIFLIGAIFGGGIGGMVGAVGLPAFTILHRLVKLGDKIESKHFYPIAFGITFAISAFILSMEF